MKIGIISDTHGIVPAWQKALARFDGADVILHAGDVLYHPPRIGVTPGYDTMELADLINTSPVPIVIARGNVDPEVCEEILSVPVLSPYAFVQIGGLNVVVNHGHTLTAESMHELAERLRIDVLVTGHTHLPVLERIHGMVHINPGSPAHPRFERDGRLTPTVGLIEDGTARVVELETGNEVVSMRLPAADR